MNIFNIKRNLILQGIQKAEGYYVDNYKNRKLGRVGQAYGSLGADIEDFEKEEDDGANYTFNPKLILKRMKGKISDESFDFLKQYMSRDDFQVGDIEEYRGEIYLKTLTEVKPGDARFSIGKREESEYTQHTYYEFIDKTYGDEALRKNLFETYKETTKTGYTMTHVCYLDLLQTEYKQRKQMLHSAKQSIYYDKYYDWRKGTSDKEEKISQISDTEAEQFLRSQTDKYGKANYKYYKSLKRNEKLIALLESYGVDFQEMDMSQYNDTVESVIVNCPRQEFYEAIKQGLTERSHIADIFLKARFMFKYKKALVGEWNAQDKDGKVNIKKRDNIIGLCNQLEFAIDDVLGEDKEALFVNNENVKYINYESGTDWGGASYSKENRVITITDEYFENLKQRKNNPESYSTLQREKFMVEGFLHELGHSTDITEDIYNSAIYKDFAKHLGYGEKNARYTIYTNAIKNKDDAKLIHNADYWLCVEKDKKQELIDKFSPFYDKQKYDCENDFGNRELASIFISGYSNKSACEGYAEYFSFYIGNKKQIDKAIDSYKKNSREFLDTYKIENLFKYHVYGGKWNTYQNYWKSDLREAKKKYYQAALQHNMEMLIDMQRIVRYIKHKNS